MTAARLADVLARARASVAARAAGGLDIQRSALSAILSGGGTLPPAPRVEAVTVTPAAPPPPAVRLQAPAPAPAPASPLWPSQEAVAASCTLSAGAGRVFQQLHRLALACGAARGYGAVPDSVVFHLPAQLLALAVGYSRRHLYRLLEELTDAGLLTFGGHAALVRGMRLYSGCLWAVRTRPDAPERPRITASDWTGKHRAFEADIDAGVTVKALEEGMSHLKASEPTGGWDRELEAWAVAPERRGIHGQPAPVAVGAPCDGASGLEAVRDVVYRLGELAHVHPQKRPEAIGRMASALARNLEGDLHSRRWYAGLLWEALWAEWEGRPGLQVLAAALARLEADRREWEGLRSPGALLAARLRAV